jgi:phosphoglycerol transferase MdoB-like AlkP superfamily enzyme
MRKVLRLYLFCLAFWLGYFLLQKVFFLLFNARLTLALPFKEIPLIFVHGFSMDLSVSFYAMIIPTLLIILSPLIQWNILKPVLYVYTAFFLGLITLVFVGDLELYHFWNFRLDKTPLKYLDAPQVMFASVSLWVIIRQLMIALLLFLLSWWIFRKGVKKLFPVTGRSHWFVAPVFMLVLGSSIIPIRGGFGVAPMNSGFAWFSSHPYANHAALNMPFHLFESLLNNQPEKNPYVRFTTDKADTYYHDLFPVDTVPAGSVLKHNRPNVIVIVLESFTAKVIEPLGGLSGVTPNMSRFAQEGILFDHFYASGDRTDKALPAILSGFPSIPNQSVTKFAGKAEHLPSISGSLKKAGYHTAFYYGGTINFAGLRAYLTGSQYDRIIDLDHFPRIARTSKWGVHDEITFDTLLHDIDKTPTPFFKVMLTLSSHEPYDVPMAPVFKGKNEETLFLNSLYYTDSVLGLFVDKAKKQSWWNNTLIIFVADHGVRLPGNTPNEAVEKFRIPMIWIGGALNRQHFNISKTASQTDIISTLFGQLGLPVPDCPFSKDILSTQSRSFAYYAFNNGFGFVTDTSSFMLDNVSGQIIHTNHTVTDSIINEGKALRQLTYAYFLGL